MATIQYKVMIKRVKVTKIGDVFEVKISDTEKKYMQYVVSDLTELNSDVVRGFKKTYGVHENPKIEEIVSDDVDFYAHCDSRFGIKTALWTLYGNSQDIGDASSILFRDTSDHGNVMSYNWYVWHPNEEHLHVSVDSELLRKSHIGGVFPSKMIYERIKNGFFVNY